MTTLNRLVLESGLSREVAADLEPMAAALHAFLPARRPIPSPELAALLLDPPRSLAPGRARRRVVALGTAAAAVSSLAITGVAAANNELPEPAQQLVSDLSDRYLPFDFPAPVSATPEPDTDEPTSPAAVPAVRRGPGSSVTVDPQTAGTGVSSGLDAAAARGHAPAGPPPAVLPDQPGAGSTAAAVPPPVPPGAPVPAPTAAPPSPTPVTSAPPSPEPQPSGSPSPSDTPSPSPGSPSADAGTGSSIGTGQDASPLPPPPSG